MTTPARLEADWLGDRQTRAVIAALEAVRPGSARFVGGCVRNALMGRPVDDIDIATQLTPDRVLDALGAAGIRAIPTGIEHGTVTAVCEGRPFEITTLRRDVETDGRRAVVAFTEDWAEDAARRDFRLNALYAELDGTLHDPTGGGVDDAAQGRVIFIGDPDERLREDYLRILRFFRFNAWYGAGIDADGLAACARQKRGLERIAAERKWKELKKLLAAPDPSEVIDSIDRASLTLDFFATPLAEEWRGSFDIERELLGDVDSMRRLMAISLPAPDLPGRYRRGYRISNSEYRRLEAWLSIESEAIEAATTVQDMRRLVYRFGREAVLDRALTAIPPLNRRRAVQLVVEATQTWRPPSFPVGGEDAKAQGLSGPDIGHALRDAEAAWIDSDFTLDRADLLAWLKPSRTD